VKGPSGSEPAVLDEPAYLSQLDAWRAELLGTCTRCAGEGYVGDPDEIDPETLFAKASPCVCLRELRARGARYKAGLPARYTLSGVSAPAGLPAGAEDVRVALEGGAGRVLLGRFAPGDGRALLGAQIVVEALGARRSAYWLAWGQAVRVADQVIGRAASVRPWFDAIAGVDLLVVDGPDTTPVDRGGLSGAGAIELGYAMDRRVHALGSTVVLSSCEPATLARWPQLVAIAESAVRVGGARRKAPAGGAVEEERTVEARTVADEFQGVGGRRAAAGRGRRRA
jgi:hypothetical protein